MFCQECGAKTSETAKFCRLCGHKLDDLPVVENKPIAASQVVVATSTNSNRSATNNANASANKKHQRNSNVGELLTASSLLINSKIPTQASAAGGDSGSTANIKKIIRLHVDREKGVLTAKDLMIKPTIVQQSDNKVEDEVKINKVQVPTNLPVVVDKERVDNIPVAPVNLPITITNQRPSISFKLIMVPDFQKLNVFPSVHFISKLRQEGMVKDKVPIPLDARPEEISGIVRREFKFRDDEKIGIYLIDKNGSYRRHLEPEGGWKIEHFVQLRRSNPNTLFLFGYVARDVPVQSVQPKPVVIASKSQIPQPHNYRIYQIQDHAMKPIEQISSASPPKAELKKQHQLFQAIQPKIMSLPRLFPSVPIKNTIPSNLKQPQHRVKQKITPPTIDLTSDDHPTPIEQSSAKIQPSEATNKPSIEPMAVDPPLPASVETTKDESAAKKALVIECLVNEDDVDPKIATPTPSQSPVEEENNPEISQCEPQCENSVSSSVDEQVEPTKPGEQLEISRPFTADEQVEAKKKVIGQSKTGDSNTCIEEEEVSMENHGKSFVETNVSVDQKNVSEPMIIDKPKIKEIKISTIENENNKVEKSQSKIIRKKKRGRPKKPAKSDGEQPQAKKKPEIFVEIKTKKKIRLDNYQIVNMEDISKFAEVKPEKTFQGAKRLKRRKSKQKRQPIITIEHQGEENTLPVNDDSTTNQQQQARDEEKVINIPAKNNESNCTVGDINVHSVNFKIPVFDFGDQKDAEAADSKRQELWNTLSINM